MPRLTSSCLDFWQAVPDPVNPALRVFGELALQADCRSQKSVEKLLHDGRLWRLLMEHKSDQLGTMPREQAAFLMAVAQVYAAHLSTSAAADSTHHSFEAQTEHFMPMFKCLRSLAGVPASEHFFSYQQYASKESARPEALGLMGWACASFAFPTEMHRSC